MDTKYHENRFITKKFTETSVPSSGTKEFELKNILHIRQPVLVISVSKQIISSISSSYLYTID